MKTAAVFVAALATASAFAPQQQSMRQSTQVDALFDNIANMDLWAPVKDSNEYGARNKKNLKQGQITGNSYVPNGLTAAQYAAIRAKDQQKKEENYKRNVNKAFKFLGYDEFYKSRGTDLSGTWKKDVNLGHRMAKTKFDWSGKKNEVKGFESFGSSIFGGKKK